MVPRNTRRGTRFLPVFSIATAALVAGLLWPPAPCHAQNGTPLSELINGGGEIIFGDKRFDEFSYAFTGDMPAPDLVNVIPIVDQDENLGIQFQGFFTDLVSSQGGSDALIGYRVSVLNPNKRIVDAHLAGNPLLLGDTGVISVTETFAFDTLGEHALRIYDDELLETKHADSTEFAPRVSLQVTKDIGALARTDGTVTLSYVDQTFSQVEIPIPEASSALLMIVGLTCLGGFVWKRGRRRRPA